MDIWGGITGKLFLASLVAMVVFPIQAGARTDPASGRVRVLFVGEVMSGNQLFLSWISADPQFTLTAVPCDIEYQTMMDAKRFARIYVPRTQDRLNDYDVTMFEDFTYKVLPLNVLDMFQSSIYEGMGIALIEFVNWGGDNDISEWMKLSFYDVFPAEPVMNKFDAGQGRTFYKVVNNNGPLQLPGVESAPLNSGSHGDLIAKPGSTTEAVWSGRKTPCMVTSTYGKGHTLQLGHGWDNIPYEARLYYAYLPDFIFHQILCIADLPYPQDLDLVHTVRKLFIDYGNRRTITLGFLGFVEQWDINPYKIERRLASVEASRAQAAGDYLAGDCEHARDILTGLLDEFGAIDQDLIRAKSRAFLWVYLVEWASVLGTSVVCAYALWSLMIRRRVYREVKSTRAT